MKSVDTLIEKALAYTPSLKKKDKERKAAMPEIIAKSDRIVKFYHDGGIEGHPDQPKDLTSTEREMLSRVKFIHKLIALVNGDDFFYSRFQKYPQSEKRRFVLNVPYLRNHFFQAFSRKATSENLPQRMYLNLWTGVALTVNAGAFSATPAYNKGFSCSSDELKSAIPYFLSKKEDRAISKGFTKYGPYWAYTVTMYLRSDEETRRLLIEGFEGNPVFMSKKIVSMIFSRKASLKENLKVLKTAVRMSKKEFAQIYTEEEDFLAFCKRMSRLESVFHDPEFLTLAIGKPGLCRKVYDLHSDLSKIRTSFTKPELLAFCLIAVYGDDEELALKLKKLPWIYHRYLSSRNCYPDLKGTESLYMLRSMEEFQGIKPFPYKEKDNSIQMFQDIVRMFLNMDRWGTEYIIDFSHGLQRAHDRIAEEQNKAKILRLSDTKPQGLYDPFIVHECFTPLETERALAIEGREMKHCVGAYIHRITPRDTLISFGSVRREFSQIYAVSWMGERATLELGVVIKLDLPPRQINEVILNRLQLFGPCNQETSEEMREFVDSFIADARCYLGFLLRLGYREMTDY